MEYQKIANLIDDASNQPSKFKTKNWVEVKDESRGTYNVNGQTKFKTAMLKSSLCDYSDPYILVKGTITVNNTAAADADANNTNKKVIFTNFAPFTNCTSEITQVGSAKDLDIVMPMYNLIEYSDNYSRTSGSLLQYCKDIPAVDNNNAIVNFIDNNLTDSYVPVVTLSTQDNAKLLQQLKSGFKRVIKWNKYSSKPGLVFLTSGSISIASFATVIGIPVGITSASLSLTFSLCTGLVKKLLKTKYVI